jgi:tetratricopeptide (TPR) repeat protein
LLWQGELHTTVEYASRGANLYDPHKHQMHIFVYGNDSLTGCRLFCGLAQWFLGYPDTALAAVLENLERAREISHPFNLVFALYFAAFVYTLRGEYLKAKILAEEVLHLAGDYRFSMYEMFAQVTLGWILVESGSIEKGREIISRYISESFKKALVPLVPVFATALSKSYRISGDRNIALRILLDIEKRIQEDSGGHIWIPEILTSKGLLSLEAGKETEETWGYFRSAVKTAHAQGARSLELRAAASWFEASMGTSEETAALSALKRIHESFEEGRNTVDLLRSAKLLSQNPGKRKPTAL